MQKKIVERFSTIIDAKHHIVCRKATSFIEDNIVLCPLCGMMLTANGQMMYSLCS